MLRSPALLPRRALLGAAAAMLVSRRSLAQQAERRIVVDLAEGAARRFDDAISDFEAVSYVVALRAGQALQIALETNHAANCFDIHAPGVEKPIYVGADSGVSHRLVAPAAGDYAIRVFLLRFAARDGQSAQYSLELTLGEVSAAAGSGQVSSSAAGAGGAAL